MPKYIFVTGGVVSSVGKGITTASIGRLLKSRGISVSIQKIDPYLNVDPGTMSPLQHGEVFVTDDGYECDLDVGHYERFVDENLSRANNITAGQIYQAIIAQERRGDFLGGTIQTIPHVINEIKERIQRVARQTGAQVVIVEVGGTVGDIEGLPFLEAIRQMRRDVGSENVLYIHTTLLPYISATGELKTKPTQHSVNELRRIGIQPDVIVCRADHPIANDLKDKIALFGDVAPQAVVPLPTVPTIYEVPLLLEAEGLGDFIVARLHLPAAKPDLAEWQTMVAKIKAHKAGFVEPRTVGPDVPLRDVEALRRHYGFSTFPVVSKDGRLLGLITRRDYDSRIHADVAAKERMVPRADLDVGIGITDLEEANALLIEGHCAVLPIVDRDDRLLSLVFRKDIEDHLDNPDQLVDEEKRLLAVAAVNTHDYRDRVPALVDAGVDVLVIDSSDGHTTFQRDTLEWIRRRAADLPIMGGNVITGEGFDYLVAAGAGAVKVGMGGGSMCITQEQKGTGRGLATAVMKVVEARDRHRE